MSRQVQEVNYSCNGTGALYAMNGAMVDKCDVEHGSGYERLVVKQNICYIVAGIVFNECNQVLMIQEAKPSCYGKWYLPAGRMEPNETIVEGVKREVLEEAGLEFEPVSVLCIEEGGGYWVRIAIVGNVVGGKLKTMQDADQESLQAMWWNIEDEIPIRCKDIMLLIHMGLEWKLHTDTRPQNFLPIEQGQSKLFMRLLIIQIQDNDNYHLLLRQRPNNESGYSYLVPTSRIHPQDRSFYKAIECLLDEAVTTTKESNITSQLKILGVLALEHSGQSDLDRDGMAVSVLVHIDTDILPPCVDSYCWYAKKNIPNKPLAVFLNNSISSGSYIPLRSLKDKAR